MEYLRSLRAQMTLPQKVAQITQLDIMEVLDTSAAETEGRFVLDDAKLAPYVEAGVGSFLNSPTAGGSIGALSLPSAEQWRGAMQQLHDAFVSAGKVRPPPHEAAAACRAPVKLGKR